MGHVRTAFAPSEPRTGERLLIQLAAAGIRADVLTPALHHEPGAFGPDLLLLVVATPEPAEAVAALQQLRTTSRLPCLVVAPPLPAQAVVELLESGADDVLDSAVQPHIALARARAVLRRGAWGTACDHGGAAWKLLASRRLLLRPCGADAQLTTAEYDLFLLLTETPGKTIGRDQVARHVLHRRIEATDRSVDNLVMRLRRKLGEDGAVKTVRGQGYMFAGFDSGRLQVA